MSLSASCSPPSFSSSRTTNTQALCKARHYLHDIFRPWIWVGQEKKESHFHYHRVIEVLARFPILAQIKFEYGSTYALPLSLILLSKSQVTLSVVDLVYRLYPPAIRLPGAYYAEQPDFTYFPLYLACLQSFQDDVIQFIASNLRDDHYNPQCLAMFRKLYLASSATGQKHLSLKATQILLDKYPNLTTVEYSGGKILDLAFHNGYSKDVLDHILHKTPTKAISVRAPFSLKEDRLAILQQHLLPNLTTLGWLTHSLEGLVILRDCLSNNTTITSLNLEIRTATAPSEHATLDTLRSILSLDRLESLSIETTSQLDIQSLCDILPNNCNLHSLTLDPPISELKPMKALLNLVEHYNVGLHQVSIEKSLYKYAGHKKMLYYLLLNRCGRALARDCQTPLPDFVQLLGDTKRQAKVHQFRLMYGLLRETPGLWCNCVA